MSKFIHLHVHSMYSLLDGLAKIDQLVQKAQEFDMDALALTDHGVMYGVIEFYQKCKEEGINPILGIETYIAPRTMLDKQPKVDTNPYHLVLLAKNREGYQNLIQISTAAHLKGYYYKPRVDKDLLKKHGKHLIALTSCLQGEIPRAVLSGNFKQAERLVSEYQEIFGKENFYLELQDHPNIPEQKIANQRMVTLSKKTGASLVATSDVHYLNPQDQEAHEVLLCIQTGKNYADENRLSMKGDDFSFKSPKRMLEAFSDLPEAIFNTQKIASQCNLDLELGKFILPSYPVLKGQTEDEHLKKLCQEGLKRRFGSRFSKNVLERLEEELSVIKKAGLAPYFLIVQDFVNWAKENGISVGPGRGCFLPKTKILTNTGRQKNIQDIKPGEFVMSHSGQKRKVLNVLNYDADEEIAVIKSKMPFGDLKLTKDHKVLVAKPTMCPITGIKSTICKPTCNRYCRKKLWKNYELGWFEAQNLRKNDLLVYPIPKFSQSPQKEIRFDLKDFVHSKNLKYNQSYVWYEIGTNNLVQKKVKRFIKLDKKLAQLLGFYVSEGWSRTRERECTIGFGFNRDEVKNIGEVRKLIQDVFGLKTSVIFHKTRNSCQVFAYSKIAALFLEKLCGKYAKNKHVPEVIFQSPRAIKIQFLTSLFKGDGSRRDNMRISYDTISLDLASQLKLLLAELGLMPSIKVRKYKKDKKDWNNSYKLTISGAQLFQFNDIFKEFQIPIRKQRFYRNDYFCDENYIYFPVQKISFEKYKGKVYDLTVEKEPSYIANEIAVHNSAAGSLISYLLGITDVDPLEYNLLFERFLSKEGERIAPPDIDLDFAEDRRDEVINYLTQKYGKEKVAQIVTFGTMASRAAVRDVTRALGMSYSQGDEIAKLIPFGVSLDQALEVSPLLSERYKNEPEVKRLIDLARQLEGVARHASTHAAGVVIGKEPLINYVPLQKEAGKEENIVTQYSMYDLEALGLLKIDILGLANLTIIDNTLRILRKTKQVNLILSKVPLDDLKTFQLLSRGDTQAVFQLESEGMKRWLKELKPSTFSDIIAMVALYRPGPMQWIPDYIAGKHARKKPSYLHPKLEPILKETYGVPIFQEQILQIARDLAGFSYSEADVLRKAIGKKIKKLLLAQKDKFIQGCQKNGIEKGIAEKIFEFIEPFARYSFNRAHSTCYAKIAYWTAYLKAHFPSEYMAAFLTNEQTDLDKLSLAIRECERMKIKVLPPDVNESWPDFAVVPETGNLRFGLGAIKNVGRKAAEAIVENRKENGPYKSLEDFAQRLGSFILNKKILESLVKSGALDRFGERTIFLASTDQILKFMSAAGKGQANQLGLFGTSSLRRLTAISFPQVSPASRSQKLAWEKELLGMYISEHPLSDISHIWKKGNLLATSNISRELLGKKVEIAGIVTKVQKIITKNGAEMAFAKVEDIGGGTEVLVFPKVLQESQDALLKDKMVLVRGKVSEKDRELKILADQIKELQEELKQPTPEHHEEKRLRITVPRGSKKELLLELKEIIKAHKGESPIILRIPQNGDFKEMKAKSGVKISEILLESLTGLLGADKVEVR